MAKQNDAPDDRMKWFEKAFECNITSVTDLVALIENPQRLSIVSDEEETETIEPQQQTAMQLCEYFRAKYKEINGIFPKAGSKADLKVFNELLLDYDFSLLCNVINVFISDYPKIYRGYDYPQPTIFGLGKDFIFNPVLERVHEIEERKRKDAEPKEPEESFLELLLGK